MNFLTTLATVTCWKSKHTIKHLGFERLLAWNYKQYGEWTRKSKFEFHKSAF